MTKLTQVITLREEKKHSVRYDGASASPGVPPVVTGIYISKHHLPTPYPTKLVVAFTEAADDAN